MAYLESLLWRIGGLTVDEAKIVPGGVKLSHRVDGEFGKIRTRVSCPTATPTEPTRHARSAA